MENIYKYADPAKTAYILRNGSIINQISEMDRFELTGTNVIFGIAEILLEAREGFPHFRSKDVFITDGSTCEELPKEKLLALFQSPKTGYAVAKTIAISLLKVNEIFERRCKQLSKSAQLVQEYLKMFAKSCDILLQEFRQKRYHWLENVVSGAIQSLSYSKGKAFLEMGKPRSIKIESQLDKLDKIYAHEADLCKQGDTSVEMFILREGIIHVLVGGNKVTEITEPGTLIGEMALLLGQKRTATLRAYGNVRVSLITKDNVHEVIQNDSNFFLNIATMHSGWESNNCILIREIDEQIRMQAQEKDVPKFMRSENKYKEEVYSLKRDVMELNQKYNMDFLDNIEDIISGGLDKIASIL